MKKFTMKDESFVCENCGKMVEKLNYTARDHCPYCLGMLKPVDIEKFKNTYKIIYKCEKCGKPHKNVMANDDDMNIIIEISKKNQLF